jgi:hypothetical protein
MRIDLPATAANVAVYRRARGASGLLASGLLAAAVAMLATVRVMAAAPTTDPITLLNSIPAAPATVSAAGSATQVSASGNPLLSAAAYDALNASITAALQPSGSVGGIDLARASSDPAYAAQMQARMQSMSMADKMAMANQMMAAQHASAGATGQIATFVGGQRSADIAAQQKIRALLDGALGAAGAKHRAVDDALNAAAKACPTDKTGWPLASCTGPLGTKSIAQHRGVEDASLGSEGQALAQARAIALAQMNKGRDLLAHATGPSASSLAAWAMIYVQMLDDYGRAIALRAGFWAHADSSKYTGMVTDYIRAPGGEIYWPLKDSAYPPSIGTGL